MSPAPVRFGRYELIQCIAAGGMGEVFLARQAGIHGFQKLAVVKVVLPHLVEDPEFTRMFLDEARIAAQLNHPNVAQVYDLGEANGAYFIAMEHVHGESLSRVLRAQARRGIKLPVPLAVRILADAAAGLDYAHRAVDVQGRPLGVVHRDVSPQNLLISFDGAVKIIDFGIAKAAGRQTRTLTGVLRGKIPYMSPEQAAGKPVDLRTDVFALGIVLWEALTGRRLFKHETDVQTLGAVTRCEVPRPSEFEPEIDLRLEAIVLKALAREPEQRYQTAGELRRELEEWLVHGAEAATSAEVGAHLRELFADRLAEERRAGTPFTRAQEIPSALFRLGSTPPPPPPARAASASTGAWIAVLAGVATALAAALAYVATDRLEQAPLQAGPAPLLQVSTTPAGADVLLDGAKVGRTPLSGVALTRGRLSTVEVSLAGYVGVRRQIQGDGNHSLELTLQPDQPPPPTTVTTRTTAAATTTTTPEAAPRAQAAAPAPAPARKGAPKAKGFPAYKARLLKRIDDDVAGLEARGMRLQAGRFRDLRLVVARGSTLEDFMQAERDLEALENDLP